MAGTPPEPWMRGPMEGVSPLIAPVLYSFQQATEDLVKYTAKLTAEQIWARPCGLTPLGFHLRHIAGSIDRLTMYLQGLPLTAEQFETLHGEMAAGAGVEELLAEIEKTIRRASGVILQIDESQLGEPRVVGRDQLPATVIGLLVHIAEHTQRHVGQAISAAFLARIRPGID